MKNSLGGDSTDRTKVRLPWLFCASSAMILRKLSSNDCIPEFIHLPGEGGWPWSEAKHGKVAHPTFWSRNCNQSSPSLKSLRAKLSAISRVLATPRQQA